MPKNGKKLLNESAVRRFMKLAEIDTLSDQFVGSLTEKYDDENLKEGDAYARDDEPEFDMDAEEGAGEEDLPPEPPELDEPAAEGPVDAEAIFTDLAQALAGVAQEHGVSMDIEGGEGEEPAELGDEEDLDMAPEDELGEEEPMMEEEEVPGVELEEEVDEDAVVAEITRRVTARLMKESRNDKVADQLAEKIMARLKKTSSRE